ncbi:signal transduction histidine kinase [Sphingomonas zeicaulis]|uniref:sensor histidine kinase n=1 Tax=Sphingomonas zeicaulis TaxID=1632740 RepID=UPI003D1B6F93
MISPRSTAGRAAAALRELIRSTRSVEDEAAVRIDYTRVEIVGVLGLIDAAFEFVFAFYRPSDPLKILSAVAAVVMIGFMIAARAARRRRPAPTSPALPAAFIISAMLLSITAGCLISKIGAMPYGYAMVVLAFAAVFMMPPRPFTAIILGTFAIYTLLATISFEHTVLQRVMAIFNVALACTMAIIVRIALYQLRQRDRHQREIIADQNAALELANADLATHIHELNELMAVAAHDLRSPLFGLRNLLQLAADRSGADAAFYNRVLDEGSGSVTAMLALIARILEAHELETMAELDLAINDIRTVATAARRRHAALAIASGVTIEIDQPFSPLLAAFDPYAMERAIDNLVSNAIRFSPEGAVVTLRCRRANGRAQIAVIDEGTGIPPDERDGLFGKFKRGSRQPLHGERGSGLGLYIARALVTAMGGDIVFEPGAERGSIFMLRLPLPRLDEAV